jgi:hypothetical protein
LARVSSIFARKLLMKHILFISPDNPFLKRSGGQVFDFATIMRLSKIFVVHVAIVADEPVVEQYDNVVIHYLSRRFERIGTLRGKFEFFFQLFSVRLPRASSIITIPKNIELLENIIRKNVINLVIYNHLESIALVDLSAKNKVLIHHNNEGKLAKTLAYKEKSILKKLFYFIESYKIRLLEKTLKYHSLLHFVLSADEMEEISVMVNEKCRLFPIQIGLEVMEYKQEDDFLYIFGNWDYLPTREGLEYVIDFLDRTKHSIKLKVSGYCSSEEFILRLKNISYIEYLGFVEEQVVKKLLNTAKVTIIPIFSGAGVKIKLVEALECSACILTTKKALEGLPNLSLIEQAVDLFDDVDQLSEKIDFLLYDEKKRVSLRKASFSYIQYYQKIADDSMSELVELA